MVCIYCHKETRVVNSRRQKRPNQVWRRRNCDNCGAIFSSIEGVDLRTAISLDIGTHLEIFSRDKLFLSIWDSLRHRGTAIEDATALCNTVIAKLLANTDNALLSRAVLTSITAQTLARFDQPAFVHYNAHHPVNKV
jgi:transcriptional repressor NrdR